MCACVFCGSGTSRTQPPGLVVHTPKALGKVLSSGTPQLRPWSRACAMAPALTFELIRHELAWDADSWWYTDGSAMEVDKSWRTGAGAYNAAKGIERRILCCAQGASNTITRAELCALHSCLEALGDSADETIATDSKAIMHLVEKGLWCLDDITEAKHWRLISAIVAQLLARAENGMLTRIVKVKSHVGIRGNEKADELARQAACHPENANAMVALGGAFDGLVWPTIDPPGLSLVEEVNAAESDECMPGPGQEKGLAANLHTALKNAARPTFQTGMTNETFYSQMWKGLRDELDLPATNAFWKDSSIPHSTIKQVLRVRTGTLHNMTQAFKMRMPYFPGLPVAHEQEMPIMWRGGLSYPHSQWLQAPNNKSNDH